MISEQLTGQLGLVVDNLVAAEVVLADGRIITCSETSEPDLFWAIRGAGHAFGCATHFTYRCIPKTEPVYAGVAMWPPLPAVIEHVVTFANRSLENEDPRFSMMVGFTTAPTQPPSRVVLAAVFYDGPAAEAEALLAPLLTGGPMPSVMSDVKARPYVELNGMLEKAATPGGRRSSKGATFQPPLPPAVLQRVLAGFEDVVREVPEAGDGGVCLFEFYCTKKLRAVGHEETAFPNRGSHQNAMIVPQWKREANDERMRKFARDAMSWVSGAPEKEGAPTAEYLNYDSQWQSGYPLARHGSWIVLVHWA